MIKTKEFLFFSLGFFFFGTDTILISIDLINTLLENVVFIIYMGLLHYLAQNVQEKTIFLSEKIWRWFYSLSSFLILVSFLFPITLEILLFRFIIIDLIVLYIGLEYFLAYKDILIVQPTRKLIVGRNIWLTLGIGAIILATTRIIAFLSAYLLYISENATGVLDHPIVSMSEIVVMIFYVLLSVSMFYTIFFSPEIFIMTKAQLIGVDRLYRIIDKDKMDDGRFFRVQTTIDFVVNYLESIDFDILNTQSETE